jgi:membrane dipeptidase
MNATEFHTDALVWDQHGCLRLSPETSLDDLERCRASGVDFASINVGFDSIPWAHCVQVLANFRRRVRAEPERYVLVDTVRDVLDAHASGRLAVSFDLEGAEALGGRLAMVEAYHALGVRTMLIAYNQANAAGGGCHGDPEQGLTDFGRAIVAEMNRVGMMVDATHCSVATTMDLFEVSTAPVIFSHSVPIGLKRHDRNITDEQMAKCAATGGVVGINGVALFLGEPDPRTVTAESLLRAIDYVVSIVGPSHVGIGLDHVFDPSELDEYLVANPDRFPKEGGYAAGLAIAGPELLPALTELMLDAGYPEADVRGILGENFLRVAKEVWGA